jgi:hypothetical protein
LRVLLVVAHPLNNAFAKAAAARIRATLERRGIEVDMIDLYADDFDPRLTGAERRGYFTTPYDSKAVAGYVARLRLAEKLVFVFTQLWFNVPGILKGSSTGRSCPAWRPRHLTFGLTDRSVEHSRFGYAIRSFLAAAVDPFGLPGGRLLLPGGALHSDGRVWRAVTTSHRCKTDRQDD